MGAQPAVDKVGGFRTGAVSPQFLPNQHLGADIDLRVSLREAFARGAVA